MEGQRKIRLFLDEDELELICDVLHADIMREYVRSWKVIDSDEKQRKQTIWNKLYKALNGDKAGWK